MEELSIVKKNYISYIDRIIEKNKVSHAYLFEIGNYDTDLIFIFDFIKMILCNIKYDDMKISDNKIIKLIDLNNYPDIKVIEPEGSFIKKNQLIELQKEYSNKSLFGKKRIYLIKQADKLNSSSANTILKFLEEPEEDIVAFLITDNRYHIIDTILSRCQIISLKENQFEMKSVESDNFLDFIDCILEPRNFFIKYNYFIKGSLADKNAVKVYLKDVENIIINYLNNSVISNSEFDDTFYSFLSKYENNYLINIISIIEEEINKLDFNINYKLWMDSFFARLIGG